MDPQQHPHSSDLSKPPSNEPASDLTLARGLFPRLASLFRRNSKENFEDLVKSLERQLEKNRDGLPLAIEQVLTPEPVASPTQNSSSERTPAIVLFKNNHSRAQEVSTHNMLLKLTRHWKLEAVGYEGLEKNFEQQDKVAHSWGQQIRDQLRGTEVDGMFERIQSSGHSKRGELLNLRDSLPVPTIGIESSNHRAVVHSFGMGYIQYVAELAYWRPSTPVSQWSSPEQANEFSRESLEQIINAFANVLKNLEGAPPLFDRNIEDFLKWHKSSVLKWLHEEVLSVRNCEMADQIEEVLKGKKFNRLAITIGSSHGDVNKLDSVQYLLQKKGFGVIVVQISERDRR